MLVSVKQNVGDSAVITLAPSDTCSDSLLELLLLADALTREGVTSINCVLQYVPYSRSNRPHLRGVSLGSRVAISMLEGSSIDRFVVFDLHARQLLGFFTKPVIWIPTLTTISAAIPSKPPEIVVSPDRGRYDDIVDLSRIRASALDILIKVRRDDSGSSELVAGARTPISGRSVILFDDEIWTGVTAIHAAESLFAAGATRIDYMTVYDFTSPEVRRRLLEEVGVATFTTTNLACPDSSDYAGRYRVIDVAHLVAGRWAVSRSTPSEPR
jgi:ribose-phosphate pyrophosphokinase